MLLELIANNVVMLKFLSCVCLCLLNVWRLFMRYRERTIRSSKSNHREAIGIVNSQYVKKNTFGTCKNIFYNVFFIPRSVI